MATPCVLKLGITSDGKSNELTTNNHSKKPPSIENANCKPSKLSKCSISNASSSNAPINSEKGNNKHTKIINNDGNNSNKTKKNRNGPTKNNVKSNPIKVQNDFMNAMTKAIIRFLDKVRYPFTQKKDQK